MARSVPDSKYLFRRNGSQNWYVRFRLPDGGKVIERSLGTTDKDAAWQAAANDIKQHKAFMYQRRQARVASVVHGPWQPEFTPGLHTLPDGRTLMATERDLTFSDGTRRPNGGPMIYLTGAPLPAAETFRALDDAWEGRIGEGPIDLARPKLVTVKTSPDDALLETYITHAGLNDVRTKQARAIWATFKSVVDKPLRECTRDDGRKIVAHLEAEHLKARKKPMKAATLRRYLVPLIATVNLATSDGKHSGINPFVNVVPDRDDSDRVLPFDDNDVKLMKANLRKLTEQDQLLVRVLAACGLRRGEAFAIDGDKTEAGCRYTIVGSKTEQSLRRVPFPSGLVKHLPKKISGPLFTGRKDNAGKRIGKWMGDIGIDVANKSPLHSFRHYVKDKLRSVGCPLDIQYEILGHERRTVAAGYGQGSPVPLLKEWLDKIDGF